MSWQNELKKEEMSQQEIDDDLEEYKNHKQYIREFIEKLDGTHYIDAHLHLKRTVETLKEYLEGLEESERITQKLERFDRSRR